MINLPIAEPGRQPNIRFEQGLAPTFSWFRTLLEENGNRV